MVNHNDPLRKELLFIEKVKTWFGRNSVIVLTMGKVGTLSICNSLDKIGFNHVHPHSLLYSYPGTHFLKNVRLSLVEHLYFTWKSIIKRLKVLVWKALSREIVIITGVRDPFSRYISAFFEQAHYLKFDTVSNTLDLVRKKLDHHGNFESTLVWFDKEIKDVFDINIYDYPFDRGEGYTVVQKGKVKIFIFRLDKLDSLEAQLGDFIDFSGFKLISHNITEDNPNYIKLKNEFKFDELTFDRVKHSPYLQYFYTQREIDVFKKKWVHK